MKTLKETMNKVGFEYIYTELNKRYSIAEDSEGLFYLPMFTANSKDMTKKEYTKMQNIIDCSPIKEPGFRVYACNDGSGFDYWCMKQEEHNYIQITVLITDPSKVNMSKLIQAIDKVQSKVEHYSLF